MTQQPSTSSSKYGLLLLASRLLMPLFTFLAIFYFRDTNLVWISYAGLSIVVAYTLIRALVYFFRNFLDRNYMRTWADTIGLLIDLLPLNALMIYSIFFGGDVLTPLFIIAGIVCLFGAISGTVRYGFHGESPIDNAAQILMSSPFQFVRLMGKELLHIKSNF